MRSLATLTFAVAMGAAELRAQSAAAPVLAGDSVVSVRARGDTAVIVRRDAAGRRYEQLWIQARDGRVIDAATGRVMLSVDRARLVDWPTMLRGFQRLEELRGLRPARLPPSER